MGRASSGPKARDLLASGAGCASGGGTHHNSPRTPEIPGQMNSSQPHGPRRAPNENPIVRTSLGHVEQGAVRSEIRDGDSRGGNRVQGGWEPQRQRSLNHTVPSIAPCHRQKSTVAAGNRESHGLPHLLRRPHPGRDHLSSTFKPRGEGQRGLMGVHPFANVGVHGVDPGAGQFDEELVITQSRQSLGPVLQHLHPSSSTHHHGLRSLAGASQASDGCRMRPPMLRDAQCTVHDTQNT
mmetsp:Transcript_32789/g.73444  ORF Transcript_32789/g.73444 Transcript_32789/m.73444 type:complete len:238 (-) Transcript_32789:8-721(-)